jgi:LysM repeat protein
LAQSLHESWAIASDDDKRAEEWEEVIGLIEQIRAINPNYDDMTEKLYAAHVNYGQQLVAEGRLEEAKLEFTRALEVKPDGGEAIAELQALAAGETPVPSATSTPTPEAQYTIHVVQPGEWLYQIARDYGTTAQAIMVANGLTSSTIRPGQRLRIPLQ